MATVDVIAPASSDPRKMPVDITDIRNGQVDFDMKGDIISMMNPSQAQRSLPTMLLYNEKGLQLFEEVRCDATALIVPIMLINLQITYLDEYYLTNAEIELLREYSDQIAAKIPAGSLVVELGSGCVPC